jgi:ribosomal protein S18 acetylase RimI-like enzyme
MMPNTLALSSRLGLRRIGRRELTWILPAVWQTRFSSWSLADFQALLQSHEILGWVAEHRKHMVGFLLCILIHKHGPKGHPWMEFLHRLWGHLVGHASSASASVHVLELAASPWSPRHEVEQALLGRLGQQLDGLGKSLRIIVPETALAVQLFLRSAGCRATRILREHYSAEEDGYLMEWHDAPTSTPTAGPTTSEHAEVCGGFADRQSGR